jgi:hypothetical protein
MRKLWLVVVLSLTGCSSGPQYDLGEPRKEVLAGVDVADIVADRAMLFGTGDVVEYSNFGQFAEEKLAQGGDWTPDWRNWSDELKGRTEVRYTTVMERSDEARAGREPADATLWYFWDENDRLLAMLREDWK